MVKSPLPASADLKNSRMSRLTGFVSANATGLIGQMGALQESQFTSCPVETDLCLAHANERTPDDNPSIGVAEYQLLPSLPQDLQGKLPSATELGQAIGLPANAAMAPRRSV
jgi:hypothetical protein